MLCLGAHCVLKATSLLLRNEFSLLKIRWAKGAWSERGEGRHTHCVKQVCILFDSFWVIGLDAKRQCICNAMCGLGSSHTLTWITACSDWALFGAFTLVHTVLGFTHCMHSVHRPHYTYIPSLCPLTFGFCSESHFLLCKAGPCQFAFQ